MKLTLNPVLVTIESHRRGTRVFRHGEVVGLSDYEGAAALEHHTTQYGRRIQTLVEVDKTQGEEKEADNGP